MCRNGGDCAVLGEGEEEEDFECSCPEPFVGRRCTQHQLCSGPRGCHNGGECRVPEMEEGEEKPVRCDCPLGFSGERCQQGENKTKY